MFDTLGVESASVGNNQPRGLEKWIDKMTSRTYENIQGALSFVVLGSFSIAFTFTAEYYNLLNALDLTPWGMTYVPVIFNTAWVIFALAVIAKVWGAYVSFRFAYRIDIANKLYALADKIDPRRK